MLWLRSEKSRVFRIPGPVAGPHCSISYGQGVSPAKYPQVWAVLWGLGRPGQYRPFRIFYRLSERFLKPGGAGGPEDPKGKITFSGSRRFLLIFWVLGLQGRLGAAGAAAARPRVGHPLVVQVGRSVEGSQLPGFFVGKPCVKQYISHVSFPTLSAARISLSHWS